MASFPPGEADRRGVSDYGRSRNASEGRELSGSQDFCFS